MSYPGLSLKVEVEGGRNKNVKGVWVLLIATLCLSAIIAG